MTAMYTAHPLADRFPMLPEDELARLADDIRQSGLRNPITLDVDGRILDGRNRYAACEIAGVEPTFVVHEGDDEAAFVLSANVSRRHLSTGQQAMSTALVLTDGGKRENGRWKRDSLAGTSESGNRQWAQRMAEAGAILDHAADLAADVVSGTMALDAAFREAERRRDVERNALADIERMQAEEDDARTRLTELAPAYMTALDNGEYRSARQAFAAWEDDNRAAAAAERRKQAEAEAATKQRRADLTHTFTAMASGVQTVGSYGHVNVAEFMADYTPDLLNPPQLARYLTREHIAAGITFLTALSEWKDSANV